MKRIATTIASGTAATAAAFALALSLAAPASAAEGRIIWTFPSGATHNHDNPEPGCYTVAAPDAAPTVGVHNFTDGVIILTHDTDCAGPGYVLAPGTSISFPARSYRVLD